MSPDIPSIEENSVAYTSALESLRITIAGRKLGKTFVNETLYLH